MDFPRPKVKGAKYDFSFSGLKTSLMYYLKDLDQNMILDNINHIAASYQEAIIDTLLNRLSLITKDHNINYVSIAGGVAANKRFREKSEILSKESNLNIFFPDFQLCTDNAGMIAMAGYQKIKDGYKSDLDLEANPNLSL